MIDPVRLKQITQKARANYLAQETQEAGEGPGLSRKPGFNIPIADYVGNLISGREPVSIREPLDILHNWNKTVQSGLGWLISRIQQDPKIRQQMQELEATQGTTAAWEQADINPLVKVGAEIVMDPTSYAGFGLGSKIPIAGKVLGPADKFLMEKPGQIMGGIWKAAQVTPGLKTLTQPTTTSKIAKLERVLSNVWASLVTDKQVWTKGKGIKEVLEELTPETVSKMPFEELSARVGSAAKIVPHAHGTSELTKIPGMETLGKGYADIPVILAEQEKLVKGEGYFGKGWKSAGDVLKWLTPNEKKAFAELQMSGDPDFMYHVADNLDIAKNYIKKIVERDKLKVAGIVEDEVIKRVPISAAEEVSTKTIVPKYFIDLARERAKKGIDPNKLVNIPNYLQHKVTPDVLTPKMKTIETEIPELENFISAFRKGELTDRLPERLRTELVANQKELIPYLQRASTDVTTAKGVLAKYTDDLGMATGTPIAETRLTLDTAIEKLQGRASPEDLKILIDFKTTWGTPGQFLPQLGISSLKKKWTEASETATGMETFKLAIDKFLDDSAGRFGARPKRPWGFFNPAIQGMKETWLATPRYHAANVLDMLSKSGMHGFFPVSGQSRLDKLFKAVGKPGASPEVSSTFVAMELLGTEGQKSVFRKIPGIGRGLIGGALGGIGGAVGSEGDPNAITAGAIAGAGLGVVAPSILEANRKIAQSIETAFRGGAAEAGLTRSLRGSAPIFARDAAEKLTAAGKDPSNLIDAITKTQGIISPDDVSKLAKEAGADPTLTAFLTKSWREIVDRAEVDGVNFLAHIHFDYQDTYKFDEFLNQIVPFHIWATRNIPFYMQHLMEKPGLFNALYKYNEASNEIQQQQNLAGRFNQMMPINNIGWDEENPEAETKGVGDQLARFIVGGDQTLFLDPQSILSVAGQIREPYIDQDMSNAEKLMSLLGMAGLSPLPPIQWGVTALTGGGNEARDVFPQSQLVREGSRIIGIPIEPEPWKNKINEMMGNPNIEGSPTEDYYIKKTILELSVSETGEPSNPAYLAAMYDPSSTIYKKARSIIGRSNLGTSAMRLAFPMRNKAMPDIEAEIRKQKRQVELELEGIEELPASLQKQIKASVREKYPLAYTYEYVNKSKKAIDTYIKSLNEKKTGKKVKTVKVTTNGEIVTTTTETIGDEEGGIDAEMLMYEDEEAAK